VSDKRRWYRAKPIGSTPRVGKILLGPDIPRVDCRVVDLSAGGACLELLKPYDVPNKFEFLHGSTKRICYLAWRRGLYLGVSYEESYQKSGPRGGLTRSTTGGSWLSRSRH
jgi:hypothetical protein